jgi:hypothetical protein
MDPDPKPKSMAKCRKHSDWDKWKAAIEIELCSLYEKEVFGPVVHHLQKSSMKDANGSSS